MTQPRPAEAFVAWLWEHQQLRTPLATLDGRQLQIIYPGRHSGSWGPDFRGALLSLDGALLHGDVEVHVHARDWHVHGHSGDHAYDRTILHVVFVAEAALPTVRADGAVVPTVALQPALAGPLDALLEEWEAAAAAPPQPVPCRTPEEAAEVLERAGMARFAAKAARFEADLTCADPPQTLWTGVFEALGYSSNVGPFRRLADRVTLAEARSAARFGHAELTALLLGEAGLLPHQRGRFALDDYSQELERRWQAGDRYGPIAPLEWRLIGVRPGNGPARRVAGAARLLLQETHEPLHTRVLHALTEPGDRIAATLRGLVSCEGDEYWQAHADLGRPLGRRCAVIGAQRAGDIVVNVLLPWAAALGSSTGDVALVTSAENVYRRHPLLAGNDITRHMARQIIGPATRSIVRTACMQQGLLHIYRGWCDARDCRACPAGQGSGVGARWPGRGGRIVETCRPPLAPAPSPRPHV